MSCKAKEWTWLRPLYVSCLCLVPASGFRWGVVQLDFIKFRDFKLVADWRENISRENLKLS